MNYYWGITHIISGRSLVSLSQGVYPLMRPWSFPCLVINTVKKMFPLTKGNQIQPIRKQES